MRRIIWPSTAALLLGVCGCYSNRAVYDPWSYAPPSPQKSWTPITPSPPNTEPLPTAVPQQQEALTLAELLDLALQNNTQTQVTWAQARSAAAQYGQTQSADFPNASGTFSFERTRSPSLASGFVSGTTSSGALSGGTLSPGGGEAPQNISSLTNFYLSQWGPQLALSYTIFDFGQLRATSSAARQALFYADYTHNRAIQTLINTIVDDYYTYLYQSQLLEAYGEDVETAQVTLDAAQLALQTGVKDLSDMLQAKTQLLQKQTQQAAQQQQVVAAFAQLLNDMGLPSNLEFDVQGLPDEMPNYLLIAKADELLERAMQQRADLLAAESDLRSKEQALKAAKKQYWPTVTGSFDIGRTYFSGGLNDGYDFDLLLSLNVPIFAGYYYRNGVKLAEANKKQSEANLREMQLAVTKDITTSHSNVKISYETLEFAKAYLESAAEQYTVMLSKYKTGTASILDVLNAQSALADARAQYANGIQEWYTSLASLAYATGSLAIQPGEEL